MSDASTFLSLIQHALITTIKISMPILVVAIFVGLSIGIFQTITHIQDPSVSFIPKLFALVIAVFLFGKVMMEQVIILFVDFFSLIPKACQR